jgi:flavin-dependent dehydrogenase
MLAAWGHSVLVLTRPLDRARGLAESLPPSARKLLAALGVLSAVDAAGFCRGGGNAVWWGDRDGDIEPYAAVDGERGYQLFRPDFDALLMQLAVDAGASVCSDASVARVMLDDEGGTVAYRSDGREQVVRGRFVLDCSGRAGVVARPFRRYESHYRMQALIGVWRRPGGWGLADESYTVVETCEDGWAWSIPVAPDTRHLVVMVDGSVSRLTRGPTLELTYLGALAKSTEVDMLRRGATLLRTWACDASLYSSSQYAGPSFLLVGDAGASIDPLSSFGIKKTLASAWVGAVAVHTALVDGSRRAAAFELFSIREQEMYSAHLRRSRDYAREASRRYQHPFWMARADVPLPPDDEHPDESGLASLADVQRAFEIVRAAESVALNPALPPDRSRLPLIRGQEIVIEDALIIPGCSRPVRYVAGVDLLRLCELLRQPRDVPSLFDDYCRSLAPVPLPAFLQSLALLVARELVTPLPLAPV